MEKYVFVVLLTCWSKFSLVNGEGNVSVSDDSGDVECREYHSIKNSSDICNFVNSTDDCKMDEGFFDYILYALCDVKPNLLPAVYVLYIIWLLYLFIALGTTAESFFCPSLEFIANNLKLSQNIAGITVVAFGNGAPDIFSAIAAFTNSKPSSSGVAIGALLGAGIFVTTVVAGAVAITKPFELAKRPFLRDVTFYLATVFWTFCLLYNGKIDLPNSIGFLLLYIFYVIVVLVGRYVNQKLRKRKANNNQDKQYDETSHLINEPDNDPVVILGPTDEEGDWVEQPLRAAHEHDKIIDEELLNHAVDTHHHKHNHQEVTESSDSESDTSEDIAVAYSKFGKAWKLINPISSKDWRKMSFLVRFLVILQVPIKFMCNITIPVVSSDPKVNDWSRILSCIHCITSPMFCVVAAKGASVKVGALPLWALFLIIGATLAVIVHFTSEEMKRPKYYWAFAYLGFIASVIWTYCIANEIVNLLQTFGALWDVSNVIMGLSLLAWGNSIGDMVADVTLAKQGFPRMAISACFGGPFFNLIIGIGLPCTIATITNGHPILIKFTLLEATLVGSLLFSLCFSYIVVPIRGFQMTKIYGIILIIIYIVYLPLAILAGTGVI
ncbi:mitochondrial sodium/calcium exchanger protein-like [Styela clava]